MNNETNNELHPIKVSTYLNVFALLIALTALTLLQPMIIELGLLSTLKVQLGIALMKAFLIVAYYMHIKTETKVFRMFIYSTLGVLAVVYLIMAIDTYYRYTPFDLFGLTGEV